VTLDSQRAILLDKQITEVKLYKPIMIKTLYIIGGNLDNFEKSYPGYWKHLIVKKGLKSQAFAPLEEQF